MLRRLLLSLALIAVGSAVGEMDQFLIAPPIPPPTGDSDSSPLPPLTTLSDHINVTVCTTGSVRWYLCPWVLCTGFCKSSLCVPSRDGIWLINTKNWKAGIS